MKNIFASLKRVKWANIPICPEICNVINQKSAFRVLWKIKIVTLEILLGAHKGLEKKYEYS